MTVCEIEHVFTFLWGIQLFTQNRPDHVFHVMFGNLDYCAKTIKAAQLHNGTDI